MFTFFRGFHIFTHLNFFIFVRNQQCEQYMDEFCILGLEYLNKNSVFRQVTSLKYFTFSLHPVIKFEMQTLLVNEETLSMEGWGGRCYIPSFLFPNIRRQKYMQRF